VEQFIGVWRLLGWEMWEPGGPMTQPLDAAPRGYLIYTPGGHMAVQMMRPERPLFTSGNRWSSAPEEVQAAYAGYNAYCGSFTVNAAEGYVSHHLECSLYPNRVGTELRRTYTFTGNQLILATPDSRMTWERAE